MNNDRLHYLLDRYFQKTQTADEKSELLALISAPENEVVVQQWIDEGFSRAPEYEMNPAAGRDILQAIFRTRPTELIANEKPFEDKPGELLPVVAASPNVKPVHRVHFLRTAWFRYAAAVLVIVGTATYLWNTQKETNNAGLSETIALKTVLKPGGNRATLTLATGQVINLDSASTGQLARDGGATISKSEGRVAYTSRRLAATNVVVYNTMTTPRGGQYQLVLPDGSKVWLNAASSITFPTVFAGSLRNVSVTGEAYFEIARDKSHPFVVEVVGRQQIEVLGTHFNVNAYEDEPLLNTTLFEGAVNVRVGKHEQLLKPGQQMRLGKTDSVNVISDMDSEEVMAWKNNYFSFRHDELPAIMRQLARWYDVAVEYRGAIPQAKFGGDIPRNLNAGEVLKILEASKVHFIIEGRKIIVTP